MYNNRNLRMCDSSPKRLESTVLHFLNAKPVQQWNNNPVLRQAPFHTISLDLSILHRVTLESCTSIITLK